MRYSLDNPEKYVESNLLGTFKVIDTLREYKIKHFLAASTSSVYGNLLNVPYNETSNTDFPVSFYATTKKAMEVMSYNYSHLYNIPTTIFRFFTVYGPWGRPDMALFKFTKSILEDKPIDVFNYGKHTRDFTYIDDIVKGVIKTLDHPASGDNNWKSNVPDPASSNSPWRIYNIGNNNPVKLMDYIDALEKNLGKKAIINFLPLQPGDVEDTYANSDNLYKKFHYKPTTSVIDGVSNFVKWYKDYFKP